MREWGFPSHVVAVNQAFRLTVRQDHNSPRAINRDLFDFFVELENPDGQTLRTKVAMTKELIWDNYQRAVPVPLEWLLVRFMVYHLGAGSIQTLKEPDAPVLTTDTYASYLGEHIDAEQSDDAVYVTLAGWTRGGFGMVIAESVLFVSTNLSITALRGSINALVARRHLTSGASGLYTVEPGVLDVAEARRPSRTLRPVPVVDSIYYREVEIEADSPFCFVIMPFKEVEFEQRWYFDIIKPLLQDELGLTCYRVDEDILPDKIDNKIFTYIVRAEFVIAELTTANPNVMYELGLAHALNKRCVVLTQASPENLPFDVNKITVSPYGDEEDLRSYLRRTVTAMLGKD